MYLQVPRDKERERGRERSIAGLVIFWFFRLFIAHKLVLVWTDSTSRAE